MYNHLLYHTEVLHSIYLYFLYQTGIANKDLVLALEPEAASIFCINTQLERNKDAELSYLKAGSKYMVVDAGGIIYSSFSNTRMISAPNARMHSHRHTDVIEEKRTYTIVSLGLRSDS